MLLLSYLWADLRLMGDGHALTIRTRTVIEVILHYLYQYSFVFRTIWRWYVSMRVISRLSIRGPCLACGSPLTDLSFGSWKRNMKSVNVQLACLAKQSNDSKPSNTNDVSLVTVFLLVFVVCFIFPPQNVIVKYLQLCKLLLCAIWPFSCEYTTLKKTKKDITSAILRLSI